MELRGLAPLVRRWWFLLLLAALLAGALGYGAANRAAVAYEADARVLVGPINADNDTLDAASQLAQTYAELATSQQLIEATANQLDVTVGSGQLRRSLDITADDVTRLITIRAEASDPKLAADIANAVAEQLTALSPADPAAPAGGVLIVDRAVPPASSPAPSAFLYAVVAAGLGALVALAALAAFHSAAKVVRSPEQLDSLTGWRIVSSVSPARQVDGGDVLAPVSRQGASYRRVAAFVDDRLRSRAGRSVVVTGLQSADGALAVAVGLAATLASSNRRVTLLVSSGPDRLPVDDALVRLGVRVQSAGLYDAVRSVTHREAALELLASFEGTDDVVVVAAPPVNESAEALVWAGIADSTILAVALDRRTEGEVRDAAAALRIVDAVVDGVVTVERRGDRRWLRRRRSAPARDGSLDPRAPSGAHSDPELDATQAS